jgi:hypothetical protein
MKNKHLIKALEKHRTHQVEPTIEQADSIHYGRLCCITCNHQHLKWLGPNELVLLGVVKEHDIGKLIKKKRNNKFKQQIKKDPKVLWSDSSQQERDFYKSYQPTTQQNYGASVLIKDRLTLSGKYTGNPLGLIPEQYLKNLIKQNRIVNKDDINYIMAHLELRKAGT